MTGVETAVIAAIPKVIPPATRAVRKLLDNHRDQQAMAEILEHAMVCAAETVLRPSDRPSTPDIVKVAHGAVRVAKTGSAEQANWFVTTLRRRPSFVGGHRPRKLQTVGSQAAMDELARWVQVSAQAEGVEPLKAENYARQAARLFMQEILTPRPRADNPDFSNRLTKAWLTQADDATAAARLLRWLEYPVLLTAAAAAAGAIFGLTGHEVLQIAAAVGAGGIAVTGGVAGYQRDRDPDTKAKSEAEFVELLGLLEQISAFVVDLVRVPFTEMPAPRPAIHQGLSAALAMPADGEDIALPKGLVVLIDDLDERLLPAARERTPLLAAHLNRVSAQLRLLRQQRPSFDQLILRDAVRDLWQALERVGYKHRTHIPSPFELPEEADKPLALPRAAAAPSIASPTAQPSLASQPPRRG